MKFSKILCNKGMKLPLKPQLYLFCTVKPICHFNPIQATRVEKRAMRILLITITSMVCGTERPIAVFALANS
jgi:hypothetical protein